MRVPLLAILLVAGCLGPSEPEATPTPETSSSYALDCSIATPSWPEPCLALASPNDSPSKTEIDLAVNPTDPLNVVVASKDMDPLASDCVWAVAQVSKDGGRTWTTSYIGGQRSERAPGEPLFGWRCITDPIMAFAPDGTLYYSIQAYDHTLRDGEVPDPGLPAPLPVSPTFGSSILMTRSDDGGLTWSDPLTLHAGDGTSVFHDYMRVAVNPATGSYYTIWNQFVQPATVVPVIVVTRDGGETADKPVYIPVPDRLQEGVVMSGLAVASDGTAYVALNDGRDAFLTVSTDDARTWSDPVQVATHEPVPRMMKNNTYRSGSGFELAIDNSGGPRDGTLYMTFADHVDEDADVNAMWSSDGGATWSAPVQVNTGTWARGDQWMERPWVDARGTLHLHYFDKSFDPENYGLDVTWARTEDGGATWTLTRLTSSTFDGGLGVHQDGGAFIGDYNGIGSAGDHLYMGFPTTVTGRAEIAVARVRLPEPGTA